MTIRKYLFYDQFYGDAALKTFNNWHNHKIFVETNLMIAFNFYATKSQTALTHASSSSIVTYTIKFIENAYIKRMECLKNNPAPSFNLDQYEYCLTALFYSLHSYNPIIIPYSWFLYNLVIVVIKKNSIKIFTQIKNNVQLGDKKEVCR